MDHPATRVFARYAMGEITNDDELEAFEEHLLTCEECRRRAVAIDLIGSARSEEHEKMPLHIAASQGEVTASLCGDVSSRNIISDVLLAGFDASMVCPACLALWRNSGQSQQRVN